MLWRWGFSPTRPTARSAPGHGEGIYTDGSSLGKAMGDPHRSHGRHKGRWSEEEDHEDGVDKSRRETSSCGLWDMYCLLLGAKGI